MNRFMGSIGDPVLYALATDGQQKSCPVLHICGMGFSWPPANHQLMPSVTFCLATAWLCQAEVWCTRRLP